MTILDLVLVHKDDGGAVTGIELAGLSEEDVAPCHELPGEVNGLLNDDDLQIVVAALAPGSSAALIAGHPHRRGIRGRQGQTARRLARRVGNCGYGRVLRCSFRFGSR